jgi:hypothetical protein
MTTLTGVEDVELKVECRTTLAKNIVRTLFHHEVLKVSLGSSLPQIKYATRI